MLKEGLSAIALAVLLTSQTATAQEPVAITECGVSLPAGDYYYPQPLRCSTPFTVHVRESNTRIDCRDNVPIRAGGQDGSGIVVGGTSRAPLQYVVLQDCGAVGYKFGLVIRDADQVITVNGDHSTASFAANKTGILVGHRATRPFFYGVSAEGNIYGVRTLGAFKPRFEKTTVTRNHYGFLAQKTDELSIITSTTNGNRYAGVVIADETDNTFLDNGPFGKVYIGRGTTRTQWGCLFNGRVFGRGLTDGPLCVTD